MPRGGLPVSAPITALEQDRADHDAWVQAQLSRIAHYGEAGNGFDVFDQSKMRKAGVWFSPEDAYRGPWRAVKPYATREFVWWIEAEQQPRITFQEWRNRARAERTRRAREDAEWFESADYALQELVALRDLLARRGELVAAARDRGTGWAAICEASGLSRMQAHTLAKTWRDEQPKPARFVEIDGEWLEVI